MASTTPLPEWAAQAPFRLVLEKDNNTEYLQSTFGLWEGPPWHFVTVVLAAVLEGKSQQGGMGRVSDEIGGRGNNTPGFRYAGQTEHTVLNWS